MPERYAVFGNPVAHSRSPAIHAEFARSTGQDVVYEAILAPRDDFARAALAFRDAGGRGANVTLPFKLDAFAFVTETTDRARAARAVNTLSFLGARIVGDNTDGSGLVRDIEINLGVGITGKRILVMGAGGAARGVLGPLLARGPASITVANRTADKAVELARQFASYGLVDGGGYGTLGGRSFDVIVNATAASLQGDVPPLPASVFAPGALAYDMMYGSEPTSFLRFARDRGVRQLADGLGMLVEQAAESFFIWRGVRPETAPVIALFRAA